MQCFYRGFGLLFQYMAKIALEKVVKELKLIKVVVTSTYWRSLLPFNEAFRPSQVQLPRSMTVDLPLFYALDLEKLQQPYRKKCSNDQLGIF